MQHLIARDDRGRVWLFNDKTNEAFTPSKDLVGLEAVSGGVIRATNIAEAINSLTGWGLLTGSELPPRIDEEHFQAMRADRDRALSENLELREKAEAWPGLMEQINRQNAEIKRLQALLDQTPDDSEDGECCGDCSDELDQLRQDLAFVVRQTRLFVEG